MKILVIRRDNIGDLVCATPLLSALRRRYPEAQLAVLANSYNAPVLAGNPDIDAVHTYTKLKHRARTQSWLGTVLGTFRLLALLRRQEFDYVVLAKSGFDQYGLALARRIAPRHIVGFAPPGEPGAAAIDMPLPPAPYAELHEVEVMTKLAERLDAGESPRRLQIFPSPQRVEEWRMRLPALARRHKLWIAVHISAREPGRVWPDERFAELIARLASRHGVGVVLLWAPGTPDDPRHPGDDRRAASIAERLGNPDFLLPARTQGLEELAAVLSLCDAFIGPDGGAMHIAAGLGLAVLALFENSAYKKRHWYPWRVPYEMITPATRDIMDISVEQVEQGWARLANTVWAQRKAL